MSSVHFVTSCSDQTTEYDQIRPKLTKEFLATLNECARIYGWSGDFVEVARFVEYINEEGGVSAAAIDLTPY